ncbi:uncharacterized protein LOC134341178 isoform X2 [Mobula hypostoma]|uniref:uncharacterized protein LOC134341178 isoform X2 n=1 Tax=Mobula hypostoma TaxID=723540 RepID=UPI002FC39F81
MGVSKQQVEDHPSPPSLRPEVELLASCRWTKPGIGGRISDRGEMLWRRYSQILKLRRQGSYSLIRTGPSAAEMKLSYVTLLVLLAVGSGTSTEATSIFNRGCKPACTNISVDLGYISVNINCCSSDFCNQEIEQANFSNTLQCQGCLQQRNDFQCSQPSSVRCQSTQDKCAEIYASLPSGPARTVTLRGCVSSSACSPDRVPALIEVPGNISCCDHNLCNGSGPTGTLTPLHPTLLLLLFLLLGLISL